MVAGHLPTLHTADADMLVPEDAQQSAPTTTVAAPVRMAATAGQHMAEPSMVVAQVGAATLSEPVLAELPMVVADTHSVSPSANLLPEMPPGPAIPDPQATQLLAGRPATLMAEHSVMDHARVSAPFSALTPLATEVMNTADAAAPLVSTAEQAGMTAQVPRLPVSPATSADPGGGSLPLPTAVSTPATVQLAPRSAAPQQAAIEEADATTAGTQVAATDHHWHGNASVPHLYEHGHAPDHAQQQHAPVQYRHDAAMAHHQHGDGAREGAGSREGEGREGGGDVLYEHLAAVLATVPALRDRLLTFAPLHSQRHQAPGMGQPGGNAGLCPEKQPLCPDGLSS